jgi:hypothetical protein
MSIFTHTAGWKRRTTHQASRFAAIRAIVALAPDDEGHDVAAEALLVIGASPDEITAALLGTH